MFRCHHVHDPRFDDQVRAEMLCYLAVSELVCMAERVTGSRPVTRSNWPASGCMPMARGVTGRNASRSRAWRPTSHPVGSRHSVSRRKKHSRRYSRMDGVSITGRPSVTSTTGMRLGYVVHERRRCRPRSNPSPLPQLTFEKKSPSSGLDGGPQHAPEVGDNRQLPEL